MVKYVNERHEKQRVGKVNISAGFESKKSPNERSSGVQSIAARKGISSAACAARAINSHWDAFCRALLRRAYELCRILSWRGRIVLQTGRPSILSGLSGLTPCGARSRQSAGCLVLRLSKRRSSSQKGRVRVSSGSSSPVFCISSCRSDGRPP